MFWLAKKFVKHALLALVAVTALHTAAAASKAADPMLVKPFSTLAFSEKVPGNPQISPVKGVPEKEASSIVMKMGRGAFPLHAHTANYQLVVIKGVMKHWDTSSSQQAAPEMGPGSFWYQPAGQVHGDACESDECVWFISLDGARDFIPHQH